MGILTMNALATFVYKKVTRADPLVASFRDVGTHPILVCMSSRVAS